MAARRCGTCRASCAGIRHPGQAQRPHPAFDGAPSDRIARVGPVDHLPHLPCPVHAHVLLVQRGQALVDDGITRRPGRGRTHPAGVVRTRGDLDPGLGQDGADRLDPVLVAVIVDERIDVGQRRSSSACAKYALLSSRGRCNTHDSTQFLGRRGEVKGLSGARVQFRGDFVKI